MNRRKFLKSSLSTGLAISAGISPVLANENISNKEKLNTLKSLLKKGTYQVFNEENINNENNFLMVFLRDSHDGIISKEINFIENLIVKQCNISNLFFEGWADHEIDKERGFQLLNGEEELIKYFLDKNYQINGLETNEEQLIALMWFKYVIYKKKEIASKWLLKGDEFLKNITFDSKYEEYYFNSFSSNLPNSDDEFYLLYLKPLLENAANKKISEFDLILPENENANYLNEPLKIIKMVEDFFNKNKLGLPLSDENHTKLVLEIRNLKAVEILIKKIKLDRISSCFTMFGDDHFDLRHNFIHYTQFSFPNALHIIFEHFFEQEFGFKPTIVLIEAL